MPQPAEIPLNERHINVDEALGAVSWGIATGILIFAGGAQLLSQHPEIILNLAKLPGCGLVGSGDHGSTFMGVGCYLNDKWNAIIGYTKHLDGATDPIIVQFFRNIVH